MKPFARPPFCARPEPWHRRLRHSLRWRLVALFLALALGTTLIFLAGTREVFSSGWREVVQPLLADYLDHLAAEIGSPPSVARAQVLTERLPISVQIEGPQVNWRSEPGAYPALPASVRQRRPPRFDEASRHAWLTRVTADGHRIRFGLSAMPWQEHPHWLGSMTLAALLLLTWAAFGYVRHLFRPLDDIRAGALRYGAGDFSQPIPMRRHDELGELGAQVNHMASNLRHMLEGQRGLLLAISHELRSPLTRARLHAELVAEGPQREALLRDLGAMRDLIADLLESERLARGGSALQREPTDLHALLREQVALQCPEQAIELALDAQMPPALMLDRSRLQLLLRNLLDNAMRHGGGAPIRLATEASASELHIIVSDQGPGVPPEQRERLAEPFYRPDAARTRRDGGVGLGLYLCRLVAESHGGGLQFEDAAPGLRVKVHLPLLLP